MRGILELTGQFSISIDVVVCIQNDYLINTQQNAFISFFRK